MRFKYYYFAFSLLFIVPALFGLIVWGLKPSVEFTGGTELKFSVSGSTLQNEQIKTLATESGITISNLTNLPYSPRPEGDRPLGDNSTNLYTVKAKEVTQAQYSVFQSKIEQAGGKFQEISFESVGPTVGKELVFKTIVAVLLASFFILLHVARQFKDKAFGVSAIVAMFHDTIIVLGVLSFLGHFKGVEIDVLIVTAVLTILSFSVHDTIVVYDRIRESLKHYPGAKFEDLVNKALTETITRSFNNSMTIIFMLLSLFLLGGETIKWFVLTLLIGTISGTYSSTFTASPLLVVWKKLSKKRSS